MPRYYKRRTYRYKPRGGRRRVYRRYGKKKSSSYGSTAWGYAKKALQVAWQVKNLLNVEYKYRDFSVADETAILENPTNGIIACLNGLRQGDTATTRDGNSVKYTKLTMSFDVTANPLNTKPQNVRWLLINTPITDSQGVLNSHFWTSINEFTSTRNKLYPYDSVVMRQGRITVIHGEHENQHISVSMKLNLHTKWIADNDETIGDISRNGVQFIIFCDKDGTEGYEQPKLNHFQTRMLYIDN